MLTIHHLGKSQSERIIWLCEELGVPYELKIHDRDPILSPPALKALHPLGTAPVIIDGDLVLPESGAITEYIITKYGGGRLALGPTNPNYAEYLFWFHFSNGTFNPAVSLNMFTRLSGITEENPIRAMVRKRLDRSLDLIEARLSKVDFLAGRELTAADIMTVFSLTTFRLFMPYSLESYPNILAYLERIGKREAYRRAMGKGDSGMTPLLQGPPPEKTLL